MIATTPARQYDDTQAQWRVVRGDKRTAPTQSL
jgi:hypothetical protein